jgi:hypothetical protein
MTAFDVLRVAVTGIVVLSATEAVTIGAVITSEMVGIASGWRLPAGWGPQDSGWAPRFEGAAFFFGQVFAGIVTPCLVLLLAAVGPGSLSALLDVAFIAGGVVGLLALALAFLAGLLAGEPVARVARGTALSAHLRGQAAPVGPRSSIAVWTSEHHATGWVRVGPAQRR